MEFRCTGYEVHSSYMNATGHNDKGTGCEIDKFLPSSELAHCLDDIIELMRRILFICHASRQSTSTFKPFSKISI